MRPNRWFLPLLIFFSCFTTISQLLAQENLPSLIRKIQPSTVVILTYDQGGKIRGQGSGFFISKNGDIITNHHVLKGSNSAQVKTADGKVFPVKRILAEDIEGDLILISIDIPKEAVTPLSVSTSLPEVGEKIFVIGSPLGLEKTVTDGIVSAVRDLPSFGTIIQITAPISPGSSGSPVMNMKGEVVGVARFQILKGQNLNFAIPGDKVVKLVPAREKTYAEWEAGKDKGGRVSAEEVYSAGLLLVGKKEYEKALPYFEEAIKKDPSYEKAFFMIGYCNGQLVRYQEATEAYKQAIRIKPDYPSAYYNMGVDYSKIGEQLKAMEAYKQAIQLKPDYADAHFGLGFTYEKLGLRGEAIETYKQAIRIKPDFATAHFNLGSNYFNLNEYREAIQAFEQVIRITPNDTNAHYYIGTCYYRLGKYLEAVGPFMGAIRIKPDFVGAHIDLSATYLQLMWYKEAIEACKQAIRIKPDHVTAHFNLGLSYLKLGDKGSALEEYKILRDLNKDFANRLFNLIYPAPQKAP